MISAPYFGRLQALDVFSGCGGLTLGLKRAGFEVSAAIELDEKACAVYKDNHPSTRLYNKDIRQITAREVLKDLNLEPGELDLLAGCPPCQGFSRIRRRNRQNIALDQRNLLIDNFSELVVGMQPKMVMLENVSDLRQYHRFQSFTRVLRANGYHLDSNVLDAQDFGVPQRRKRLILLASRIKKPILAPPQTDRKSVYQAIGRFTKLELSLDHLHNLPERRSPKVDELIRAIPRNGGSRSDLPASFHLACHQRSNGFGDVYGRMKWSTPAPTITSGCSNPSKGRFLHPVEHRCISLREASILQGFPIDYKFDVRHGKEALTLMIGNALPPPFVEAHARALIESTKCRVQDARKY